MILLKIYQNMNIKVRLKNRNSIQIHILHSLNEFFIISREAIKHLGRQVMLQQFSTEERLVHQLSSLINLESVSQDKFIKTNISAKNTK